MSWKKVGGLNYNESKRSVSDYEGNLYNKLVVNDLSVNNIINVDESVGINYPATQLDLTLPKHQQLILGVGGNYKQTGSTFEIFNHDSSNNNLASQKRALVHTNDDILQINPNLDYEKSVHIYSSTDYPTKIYGNLDISADNVNVYGITETGRTLEYYDNFINTNFDLQTMDVSNNFTNFVIDGSLNISNVFCVKDHDISGDSLADLYITSDMKSSTQRNTMITQINSEKKEAIAHNELDRLIINGQKDYTGGVHIKGGKYHHNIYLDGNVQIGYCQKTEVGVVDYTNTDGETIQQRSYGALSNNEAYDKAFTSGPFPSDVTWTENPTNNNWTGGFSLDIAGSCRVRGDLLYVDGDFIVEGSRVFLNDSIEWTTFDKVMIDTTLLLGHTGTENLVNSSIAITDISGNIVNRNSLFLGNPFTTYSQFNDYQTIDGINNGRDYGGIYFANCDNNNLLESNDSNIAINNLGFNDFKYTGIVKRMLSYQAPYGSELLMYNYKYTQNKPIIEGVSVANQYFNAGDRIRLFGGSIRFDTFGDELEPDHADNHFNDQMYTRMVIDGSGNIGIGDRFKTIGVSNDPNVKMEIDSTDAIKIPKGTDAQRPIDNSTANSAIDQDFYKGYIRYNTERNEFEGFGALNQWKLLGGVKDVDGNTYISAELTPGANDDTLRFFAGGNEYLTIEPDGKITVQGNLKTTSTLDFGNTVGVGTTNPSSVLHLVDSSPVFILEDSSTTQSQICFTDNEKAWSMIRGISNDFTSLKEGSSETRSLNLRQTEYRGELLFYTLQGTTTGSSYPFTTSSDGDLKERMRITGTGNVGIGTNNPLASLHVFNNNGLTVSPSTTTGSRTAILRLGQPHESDHDAYCAKITSTNNQSQNYESDLRFYTSIGDNSSATERMCILSNGNVGIGIDDPIENFEISGNMLITNNLITSSTIFDGHTSMKSYNKTQNVNISRTISGANNNSWNSTFQWVYRVFIGKTGDNNDYHTNLQIKANYILYTGDSSSNYNQEVSAMGTLTICANLENDILNSSSDPLYNFVYSNDVKFFSTDSGGKGDWYIIRYNGYLYLGTFSQNDLSGANSYYRLSASIQTNGVSEQTLPEPVILDEIYQDGTYSSSPSSLSEIYPEQSDILTNSQWDSQFTNSITLDEFSIIPKQTSTFSNVGIGTKNPAYELDVNGDLHISGDLVLSGNITQPSGTQSKWVEGNNNSAYYDSGFVGIGVSTPGAPLHVKYSNHTGSLQKIGLLVENNGFDSTTTDHDAALMLKAVNDGECQMYFNHSGSSKWSIYTHYSFDGSITENKFAINYDPDNTASEKICINDTDGTCRFGFNTSTPLNDFHFYGDNGLTISPITTGAERTASIVLGSPPSVGSDQNCSMITSTNDPSVTADQYNSDLKFYTNNTVSSGGNYTSVNTEKMRIDSDGNVAIGAIGGFSASYTISKKLEVAGTSLCRGNMTISDRGLTGTTGPKLFLLQNDTDDNIGGGSETDWMIWNDVSGNLRFVRNLGSSTDDINDTFVIDNSGNVGIDMTNSGNGPDERLHVDGNIKTTKGLIHEALGGSTENFIYNNLTSTGSHIWQTNSSEAMRLNEDGILMITDNGSTSPAANYKFYVEGDSQFKGNIIQSDTGDGSKLSIMGGVDGGSSRGIYMWDIANKNWGIYMASSDSGTSLNDATPCNGFDFTEHALRFRAYYSGNDINGFIFENSNEELLASIRSSDGSTYIKGNLSIGTSNTGAALDLSGNIHLNGGDNVSREIIFSDNNDGSTDKTSILYNGSNTLSLYSDEFIKFIESDNNDEQITFDVNNGHVGIGLNNPSAPLHIYEQTGTSAAGNLVGSLVIQHVDASGESSIVFPSASDLTNNFAAIEFENDTTLKLISNNSTNSEIKFQTDGNDRVTIDSNGNVGIGTTNPSENLDVVGNIKSSGIISAAADTDTISYIAHAAIGNTNRSNWATFSHRDKNDGNNFSLSVNQNGYLALNHSTGQSMIFAENNDTKMTLTGGKLGIGTTSPASALHIFADRNKYSQAEGIHLGRNGSDGDYDQAIEFVASGNHSYIDFKKSSSGNNNYEGRIEYHNTNHEFTFYTNNTARMKLDNTGEIEATSYLATSDIRHKENICSLEDPLEKICSIRGVGFNFKDDKNKHAGIIAQEVDLVIPEAVNKTNSDKWSANYNTLVGYLIESVKVLNKEKESRQTYIEKLESRLDKQEELINKLLEKVAI